MSWDSVYDNIIIESEVVDDDGERVWLYEDNVPEQERQGWIWPPSLSGLSLYPAAQCTQQEESSFTFTYKTHLPREMSIIPICLIFIQLMMPSHRTVNKKFTVWLLRIFLNLLTKNLANLEIILLIYIHLPPEVGR